MRAFKAAPEAVMMSVASVRYLSPGCLGMRESRLFFRRTFPVVDGIERVEGFVAFGTKLFDQRLLLGIVHGSIVAFFGMKEDTSGNPFACHDTKRRRAEQLLSGRTENGRLSARN